MFSIIPLFHLITHNTKSMFYPPVGYPFRFSRIHMLLIWVLFYIGMALCFPGDTFSTSNAYYYFAILGSENQWACFFLGMAWLGALGLRWPQLRVFSAHALSIAHLILALLIGFGNPLSIATGTYLGLAISGFAFLWTEKSNCYSKKLSSNEPLDLGHYVSAAMYRHHRKSLISKYLE